MNFALLAQGLSISSTLRNRLKENREKHSQNDYDELREAALANRALNESDENEDEKFRQAGPVTKAAHKRVAKLRKQAERDGIQKRKDKAERRQKRNKKLRRAGIVTLVLVLIAAVAGAVFGFLRARKENTPADTPPRIEEHTGEQDAKLVYSTSTEEAEEN